MHITYYYTVEHSNESLSWTQHKSIEMIDSTQRIVYRNEYALGARPTISVIYFITIIMLLFFQQISMR